MKKANSVALGAIWFGAAVSVAEIEAGIQIGGNWSALILGHLLGGLLLFAAGLIGATTNRNAMETTAEAFGVRGGRFFAALNILQLVGWTAVMVSQGATAIRALSGFSFPCGCAGLAVLVAIWLLVVSHDRFHLATIGMALLAVMAVVLTVKLDALSSAAAETCADRPPFWTAFEISVSMPLSWLPLISDWTREAKCPVSGSLVSALVYTAASGWMFALGSLLARSGSVDLATGIAKAGLGWVGLVVVAFSTVTTTFLDAYSSGESMKAITPKARPQAIGVSVCGLGAVLAIGGIVDRYVDFLSLIASVFAPMAAVLIVSHFAVRRALPMWNGLAWLAGTLASHFAASSPIGPTLTSLLVSGFLTLIARTPQIWYHIGPESKSQRREIVKRSVMMAVGFALGLAATGFGADVRIKGPYAERMERMFREQVVRADVDYLTGCYFERNETRRKWQTEFWGKWMHSAVPLCRYFGCADLARKIDAGIGRVISAQRDDGYIGNYPDDQRFSHGWDVWGTKYTMLGLLHDAETRVAKGEARPASLKAASRLCDYLIDQFQNGKLGRPLRISGQYGGLPSGSVLEPVMRLYNLTHEAKYLSFARYVVKELTEYPDGPQLVKHADMPLADRRLEVVPEFRKGYDAQKLKSQLLKAYEMMSCYYGLVMFSETTGERRFLDATVKTARRIVDEEVNLAGGCSAGEYWYGGRHRQQLEVSRLQETCVTITWMRLCEKLLAVTGDPFWAEQFERTFYNAYLASLKGDDTTFAAYTPLSGDRGPSYHNCWMYINCCSANGPRGFVSLLNTILTTKGDDLFLNLYFSGKAGPFRIYTRYPAEAGVEMRYVSDTAKTFALSLRIPETWSNAVVRVNGKERYEGRPGTYLKIGRAWQPGDLVDVTFAMPVKMHVDNAFCAFTRGPILLARASRFGDGPIDAPIDVTALTPERLASFTRVKRDRAGMRMTLAAFLPVGTHTEDPENGDVPSVVKFCDYASAADAWTPDDTCRTWFPVMKNGRSF